MASKFISESFCSLHHSEFKLFCEDDKQLVCLVCRDSKLHKNHNFSPISEAALEHKEEVKISLQPLQTQLDNFKQAKTTCDETAKQIGVQAKQTENQIREEFRELHQFLRREEAARIAALRDEEKQKSRMMREKTEKMNREITSLSDTIRTIEEEMGADDVTFLQNFQNTVERAQCTLQDPERITGALIHVAKHLGNLKFRVWEKMQEIVQYTPVILDPNTADPRLILSGDLTSMRYSRDQQPPPNNPGRSDLKTSACVLGSEGFTSGTHCWDVEVGNSEVWILGVKTESSHHETRLPIISSGVWCVWMSRGMYGATCPTLKKLITVRQTPRRIRVQLDWDRGKLSFSDLYKNTNLYTFTHTFTERVFPEFGANSYLRILPVKIAKVERLIDR